MGCIVVSMIYNYNELMFIRIIIGLKKIWKNLIRRLFFGIVVELEVCISWVNDVVGI